MQIVSALPQQAVLAILAAAHRRTCSVHSVHSMLPRPLTAHLRQHQLLQLLPRTFHPAIVQACCMSRADERCCVIGIPGSGSIVHSTPRCLRAHACRAGSAEAASNAYPAEPGPPSATFQLLAAAAPLAGGSLEAAWDAANARMAALTHACAAGAPHVVGGSCEVEGGCGAAANPRDVPGQAPKRVCLAQQAEPQTRDGNSLDGLQHHARAAAAPAGPVGCIWQLPSGSMTSLVLAVGPEDTQRGSARQWCSALAQLRALRSLSINMASSPNENPVNACIAAALRCLTNLQQLNVACKPLSAASAAGAPPAEPMDLLDSISQLPKLEALGLEECFSSGARSERQHAAAVSCLPQLTLLTFLSIKETIASVSTSAHLDVAHAAALLQLPALRELHVALRLRNDTVMRRASDLLWERLTQAAPAAAGVGFQALKHFGFRVTPISHNDIENVRFPVAAFQRRVSKANPSLLTHLTALELAECRLSASQGADVATLAADMPTLRLLNVSWNELGDDGLRRLAESVPRLLHLEALSIAGNGATHTGVFAVLAALPTAQVATGALQADAEGLRLRSLDISDSYVPPTRARELAGFLRRLRGLQRLDMDLLGLQLAGLRAAVGALKELPRLRCLHACGQRACDDPTAVRALFQSLSHVDELHYGVMCLRVNSRTPSMVYVGSRAQQSCSICVS